MLKVILFDFARVFVFPRERGYTEELNKLYSQNQNHNFPHTSVWSYFYFDEELLAYIKDLLKSKYRVCMYTSGTMQKDDELKEKLNGVFEHIFSAEEMGVSKKDPESYLQIAKILGVEPQEILFIDDNRDNTTAAHHAGCVTHVYQDFAYFKKAMELFF